MRGRTLAAAVLCGLFIGLSGLAWSFARREQRAENVLERLNVNRIALDYKIDRAKAREEALLRALEQAGH